MIFHPPFATEPNLGDSLENYVEWMRIIVKEVIPNCYQTNVEFIYDSKTSTALCFCIFNGTHTKTPEGSNLPPPTMKHVATDCSFTILLNKEGKISNMVKVWNSEWFQKALGWMEGYS